MKARAAGWQPTEDGLHLRGRRTSKDGVDQSSAIGTAVVGPVIRGWSNAIVDDELAQRILTRIATLDMSGLAGDVAAMLADIHEPGSQGTEWRRFATGRELAKTCWEVIETGPAEQKDDWFHSAINSPTGQLAIYWIQAIEDEHAKAGGDWHGLPPELSAQLAAMLTCGDGRGDLVEVVFGRYASFLYLIDPSWCEEHVLQLFDWGDEARALRVWSGYLSSGLLTWGLCPVGNSVL